MTRVSFALCTNRVLSLIVPPHFQPNSIFFFSAKSWVRAARKAPTILHTVFFVVVFQYFLHHWQTLFGSPSSTSSAPESVFVRQDESFLWRPTLTNLSQKAADCSWLKSDMRVTWEWYESVLLEGFVELDVKAYYGTFPMPLWREQNLRPHWKVVNNF